MAFAKNTYTAGAAQTDFTISFDGGFLDNTHVDLTIDGVASTAFTIPSATILRLDTPAVGGEIIVVFRTTPDLTAQALVQFTSGVPVTQSNMDTFYKQLLFIMQEAKDDIDDLTAAGTAIPAAGGDNEFLVTSGGAWLAETATQARASLALDHYPTAVPADSSFLVGDGADYVNEAAATAQISMGLGHYPTPVAALDAFLIGNATDWIETSLAATKTKLGVGGIQDNPVAPVARYSMTDLTPVNTSVSGTWHEDDVNEVQINSADELFKNTPSQFAASVSTDEFTLESGLWRVTASFTLLNTHTTVKGAVKFDLVRDPGGTNTREFMHASNGVINCAAAATADDRVSVHVYGSVFLNLSAQTAFRFVMKTGTGTVNMENMDVTFERFGVDE